MDMISILPDRIVKAAQAEPVTFEIRQDLLETALPVIHFVEVDLAQHRMDAFRSEQAFRSLKNVQVITLNIGFQQINGLDASLDAKVVDGIHGHFHLLDDPVGPVLPRIAKHGGVERAAAEIQVDSPLRLAKRRLDCRHLP